MYREVLLYEMNRVFEISTEDSRVAAEMAMGYWRQIGDGSLMDALGVA